jgi:hypothetical protein
MSATRGIHFLRALLVSACVLAVPAASHAQSAADVASARDLFKEAALMGLKGDWEGARSAYAKSLKLKRAPITLYSIAVAEKNTGHLIDALEHFRAFLAEPSTPATQPYEDSARGATEELAKRVAHVLVKLTPDGAGPRVTIDGVEVPTAALDVPRMVDPGEHEVAASANGYLAAKQSVRLAEGGSTTVTLALAKAPVDAAAPEPPVLAPAARSTEPPSRAPDSAPLPNRTLPVALMVGGGALLAGGVVVGLLGVSQASGAPTQDGPDATSGKTKALAGDIVGGVGIAAAGLGVVLFVLGKPTRARGSSVAPQRHESAWSIMPWGCGDVAGLRLRY